MVNKLQNVRKKNCRAQHARDRSNSVNETPVSSRCTEIDAHRMDEEDKTSLSRWLVTLCDIILSNFPVISRFMHDGHAEIPIMLTLAAASRNRLAKFRKRVRVCGNNHTSVSETYLCRGNKLLNIL